MIETQICIEWPNGEKSYVYPGTSWLAVAKSVGVEIPTGCLSGSCGACEIEVNGKVVRACINNVENTKSGKIKVDFAEDPYW
ncbi:2Fe-2S iron-sulfur cluster-binding protein [Prochlorococcus sp. MIT 1300]|uniref:2Fe-2S iron-sulfur cluster-binding protein n=1 Tax=Prochlorococcus sp. MIT 1300 TaxID=3096218 RepID=UPI002A758C3D|nr:2Fe-2S iron-sulfur cluster-binding protein [Prochlorococcus sp. MIT 1300]